MRKSIYIEGFSHGNNPVPAATVMGHTLMTGAIFGTVCETGKVPEAAEDQCRLMFDNARRILEAAGGSFANVLKMSFFLRPETSRELLNTHWVAAFPDPDSRPARHVIVSTTLPASMALQCDMVAHLDRPL
ncbi:MAG: RidA family protein [Burkholderiaceae bacterium]|nr:RidA family protein [Burkholderiaceae bacterium]